MFVIFGEIIRSFSPHYVRSRSCHYLLAGVLNKEARLAPSYKQNELFRKGPRKIRLVQDSR